MVKLEGFEAGDVQVPAPPFQVEPGTRERLVELLAAVVMGETPEDIAAALERGEPLERVVGLLAQPGQREELSAHVDLFLTLLQGPAGS